MNERDIFIGALVIESSEEQAAFLDQVCAGDSRLRQRVEALLRSNDEGNSFLESPPVAIPAPTIDQPVPVVSGTQIGPYKLREQIGEGGFGIVYLAEQTEPVKRRVALKIIKPGMDTREVIARFEAERQALALMDHPNIAKVLDAGTTGSPLAAGGRGDGTEGTGSPYFVMELVKGIPVTDYCDQCSLTTRERLKLFVPVCQAIQHAHQKGVIHRDIKPSNVLIAMQDGRPVPKVIDFGVAKAINQRLTEWSVVTGFAQLIGTPLYMSPEQAELSPLDVDTRSDVYSLGVLLYELLTGTTPFERARFKEVTFDELRRIIREEEPTRPSARISTLGAELTTIAEHRRTEPRRLQQLVRGDLDWIVMKSLEKDRTRRYETVSALAADVQRHLADEPIEACPPSFAYRTKKFLRRNRAAVTAAVIILAGITAATSLGIVAHRRGLENEAERIARTEAERWAETAERERTVAEQRQRDAELDALVEEALRVSSGFEPDYKTAEANLTKVLHSRPDRADVYLYRGSLYYRWGHPLKAISDLEQSLELRPEDNLAAHQLMAVVSQQLGRRRKSAEHLKLAQAANPDSVEALVTQALALNNRQGIELLTRAIEQQPFDPVLYRHRGVMVSWEEPATELFELGFSDLNKVLKAFPNDARIYVAKGYMYFRQGRFDEAKKCYLKAIELDPSDARSFSSVGGILHEMGSLKAEEYLLKAIELDPEFANAYGNLGLVYRHENRLDEAEKFLLKAIELDSRNPECYFNLGLLYYDQKRLDEAETSYLKSIELDPGYAAPWNNLGNVYKAQDRRDKAEEAYLKAIGLDPDLATPYKALARFYRDENRLHKAEEFWLHAIKLDPNDAEAYNHLGALYWSLKRLDKAEEFCLKAIELYPDFGAAYSNLGLVYVALDRLDQAEKAYRKAIDLDPNDPIAWNNLGDLCRNQNRPAEAEEFCLKAIELDPDLVLAYKSLGSLYSSQGRFCKAEESWLKVTRLDPDDAEAYLRLGNMYSDQHRLDEAEKTYLKAIEIDPGGVIAYFNLGNLYTDQNRLDKAEESYLKAIELDSDYVDAYVNLTNLYWVQNNLDEAEKYGLKAIELDPRRPGIHFNLGLVYWKQDRRNEAKRSFLKTIELDPDFVKAYGSLGFAYRLENRLDEAQKILLQAVQLNPRNSECHLNLGLLYWDQKRLDDAKKSYLKAIELAPHDARPWHNLGNVYYAQGCLDDAEESYRKAVELNPHFAGTYNNLGNVYLAQNRLAEAKQCWLKVIELTPGDPSPLNNLAWILANAPNDEVRDAAQAVEFARKAVKAAPENGGFHNTLGVALYRAGDFADAITTLEKACQLKRNANLAFDGFFLAMAHWQLGQKDEARQWYEKSATWMKKHDHNQELLRFRVEAEVLMKIKTEETKNKAEKTDD